MLTSEHQLYPIAVDTLQMLQPDLWISDVGKRLRRGVDDTNARLKKLPENETSRRLRRTTAFKFAWEGIQQLHRPLGEVNVIAQIFAALAEGPQEVHLEDGEVVSAVGLAKQIKDYISSLHHPQPGFDIQTLRRTIDRQFRDAYLQMSTGSGRRALNGSNL